MLLLSSPLSGRQRRASLLLLAAVLLCVPPATASPPAGRKCPLHIDCAKEGRHLCKPGSSHCGPCLSPLVENEEGRCVARKRHHQHGKVTFYPDLDEEIDFLHSYIEKQEVTEIKPTRLQSQHPAALHSPTDVQKNKTDVSKHMQDGPARPSAGSGAATAAPPNTQTPQPRNTAVDGRAGPIMEPAPKDDRVIVIVVSLCVVVGTVAVILATIFYIKLQRESHLSQKVDYPAYGRGGVPAAPANSTSVGDKTLAQSAQMFHYQHQKQQMLSLGSHKPEQKAVDSEVTSDEEEVGGDFTVYECPGLAPTGEMEVKNPLFDDSNLHYQGNQK